MVSILNTGEIYEKLNSCNKCGFCQASCRVYKETLKEFHCARGRIRMIKAIADKDLERSKFYEDVVNSCLLCLDCSKTCPSGVPIDQLILAARQDLAETRGLGFPKKMALKRVLASNAFRKFSFKSAKIMQGFKKLHGFRGIDVAGMPVSEEAFLDTVDKLPKLQNPKAKVAFFVGCMFNHSLTDTARNLVKVLHANNVEVVIPKDQQCCGTPQHVYGEIKTFNSLVKNNIEQFNKLDVDAVITACGSCGATLKDYKDSDFASKVKDINEYLVDVLKIDLSNLQGLYGKVTYHDPCHLIRGQGITAQPRKLLKDLPGTEYIEMPKAANCCGAAGMFQGFYPEISVPITNKKVDSIIATGADTVVTSCPACVNRIQGSLNLSGNKQKVIHVVDLLAMAYEKEQSMG